MQGKLIGRRHALKYFGYLSATVAGREFLESWLPHGSKLMAASAPGMAGMHGMAQRMDQGASPADTEVPYVPRFFKSDEFRTVEILTEIILPTDEQPGAKEAKVANYIDFLVYSAAEFKPSMQKEWISGLATLSEISRKKFGSAFANLSSAQREELLTEMSLPEREPNRKHPGFQFYSLLKDTTIEAFFTSKVGLVDFLGYKGRTFMSEFPGCTHPEHKT